MKQAELHTRRWSRAKARAVKEEQKTTEPAARAAADGWRTLRLFRSHRYRLASSEPQATSGRAVVVTKHAVRHMLLAAWPRSDLAQRERSKSHSRIFPSRSPDRTYLPG